MASGRSVLIAVGGLLVGYLLGSLASNAKLRPLEEELNQVRADLEKEKRQRAPFGLPMGFGLPGMLGGRSDTPSREDGREEEALEGGGQGAATPKAAGAERGPASAPLTAEERNARIRTAVETWNLRRTQARTAFLQQLEPDAEQQKAFEAVVDSLNRDLEGLVKETLERLPSGDRPTTRDAVDFAVALGNVYQDADDSLQQMLTESQRPLVEEASFDVFSQVDPEVVLPLVERMEQLRPAQENE